MEAELKQILLAISLLFPCVSAFADDANFSTHLFAKFQVKACTKCHDFFEQERNGLAFNSHRERSTEMCVVCHQKSVTGYEHPEDWFAMSGLYTSGMDAIKTCEATKTALHAKFKSSPLLKRELKKHLFEDPRVLWGIEGATLKSGQLPGGKKEDDLIKGGLALWKEQVNAWIDGGMICR
jgi:hypothetical protein